jgi:hypothetical protein
MGRPTISYFEILQDWPLGNSSTIPDQGNVLRDESPVRVLQEISETPKRGMNGFQILPYSEKEKLAGI